jgi:hypothetical protein
MHTYIMTSRGKSNKEGEREEGRGTRETDLLPAKRHECANAIVCLLKVTEQLLAQV